MNRNVCDRNITSLSFDQVRKVSPTSRPLESADQESPVNADGARLAAIRLLRLRDVCAVTGLGKSIIYRMQSERRFPQRVKITEHAVGWVEAEISAWIAQRIAIRSPPSMPK